MLFIGHVRELPVSFLTTPTYPFSFLFSNLLDSIVFLPLYLPFILPYPTPLSSVAGIDAVPPEEGDEDGEWPDALAQLYLSRLQRHPAVVELTDLVDGPEGPKLVEQQESSRKVIGKWLGLPLSLLPALPGAAEGELAGEGAENLRTVRKQQRRQELLTILQLRRSEDLRQRSRQSAAGF